MNCFIFFALSSRLQLSTPDSQAWGVCGQSDDTGGGRRNAWGLLTILAPEIRVQATRRSLFDPGFSYKGFHSGSRSAQSFSFGTHIFQGPCKHSHSRVPSPGLAPLLSPSVFAVRLWKVRVKFSLQHVGNIWSHSSKKTELGAFLGADLCPWR